MIFGSHDGAKAPTHIEIACDGHLTRVADIHKIVKYAVDYRLIKYSLLPEGEEIHFERLEFEANTVGHIVDRDGCKVGLSGDRADRRELRAGVDDTEIALGARAVESLEQGGLLFARYLFQRNHTLLSLSIFGIQLIFVFKQSFRL